MTLHIIGSSSEGNCYLLKSTAGETLILEAGCNPDEVKKSLSWKIKGICGLVCSHSHGDHSKYIHRFAHDLGIKVYASGACLYEAGLADVFYPLVPHDPEPIEEMRWYNIGSYKVLPLEMVHDVKCQGFVIKHPEMGSLLFATDTEYIRQKIAGINHLLIECNYADDILEENIRTGVVSPVMRSRLLHTHMEEKTTMDYLRLHNTDALRNIVLLHLSSNNGNAERFQRKAEQLTGKPTYIAKAGVIIKL